MHDHKPEVLALLPATAAYVSIPSANSRERPPIPSPSHPIPMSSLVAEEEATDVPTEEGDEVDEDKEERREGAPRGPRVSAGAAAVADGDGGGGPRTTCCVCMVPWTCSGAHRVCCIPCGHVYGRLCLEIWLRFCGNTSAKCPQCGQQFKLKDITNLYAPGNLWDDSCHIQEAEACYSKVAKYTAMLKTLIKQHMSEARSSTTQLFSEFAENEDRLKVIAQSALAANPAMDVRLLLDMLEVPSHTLLEGQMEVWLQNYEGLVDFVLQSFRGLLQHDSK